MKKLIKTTSIILFFISIINSCTDEEVFPPIGGDFVEQKDIVWSSLSNVPWPMYHQAPQSTGRTKFKGPQNGIIENIQIDNFNTLSSLVIGSGQTVFLSNSGHLSFPGFFLALDYSGTTKWKDKTALSIIKKEYLI